jgi:hypothetical protein
VAELRRPPLGFDNDVTARRGGCIGRRRRQLACAGEQARDGVEGRGPFCRATARPSRDLASRERAHDRDVEPALARSAGAALELGPDQAAVLPAQPQARAVHGAVSDQIGADRVDLARVFERVQLAPRHAAKLTSRVSEQLTRAKTDVEKTGRIKVGDEDRVARALEEMPILGQGAEVVSGCPLARIGKHELRM